MNDVVPYYEQPRVGTFVISKGFGRDHKDVLKLIRKHEKHFLDLENNSGISNPLIISRVPSKKAGRPVEEIMLNEAQFIFFGTLLRNSDLVIEFKKKLAGEFVNIRNQLYKLKEHKSTVEYKSNRGTGKLVRKTATDEIKRFIEYAKEQGSDNADRYYANITGMVNGLLFISEGRFKSFRDVLTAPQLFVVSAAEGIVDKGLRDGMKANIHYKTIYQKVKANVELFAELHGQSEVISKHLALVEDK